LFGLWLLAGAGETARELSRHRDHRSSAAHCLPSMEKRPFL